MEDQSLESLLYHLRRVLPRLLVLTATLAAIIFCAITASGSTTYAARVPSPEIYSANGPPPSHKPYDILRNCYPSLEGWTCESGGGGDNGGGGGDQNGPPCRPGPGQCFRGHRPIWNADCEVIRTVPCS